jgi:hypothetical protein
MATPPPVTIIPADGVTLADGTAVDWIEAAVIDRLCDVLLSKAHDSAVVTPDSVTQALTALLSHAERCGERWAVDAFRVILDDGIASVQIVAEHRDEHGWIVLLGVPA